VVDVGPTVVVVLVPGTVVEVVEVEVVDVEVVDVELVLVDEVGSSLDGAGASSVRGGDAVWTAGAVPDRGGTVVAVTRGAGTVGGVGTAGAGRAMLISSTPRAAPARGTTAARCPPVVSTSTTTGPGDCVPVVPGRCESAGAGRGGGVSTGVASGTTRLSRCQCGRPAIKSPTSTLAERTTPTWGMDHSPRR
jgi:hypothetical protein